MKIFLETSIQIQRLLHTSERKAYIRRQLTGKFLCTSMYGFMEFRRGILQIYAYMKSLLDELVFAGHSEISLSDFIILLSQARGISRSPRAIQRTMLVLADIVNQFESGVASIPSLLDYLILQPGLLERKFFQDIDEVINATDCDLVKPTTPLGDLLSSRLSCNAATAQCKLVTFLSDKRKELQQIRNAMERLSPLEQDTRAYNALARIQPDLTLALGERTCWALGDIIIALSVPDDALVYTADGHFRKICSAIGKKIFEPKLVLH